MNPLGGILLSPDIHHLDHLAPLCSLLEIPLIVSTQEQQRLAALYYPELIIRPLESAETIVKEYDRLITTAPRALFDRTFFFAQHLLGKEIKTLWLPHGNSDKGRESPFMEGLREEETLLVYGPLMEAFLKEKGVIGQQITIGNYRLAYFEQHRSFYESHLPPLRKMPTLLWAPTWVDEEKSSSFQIALKPLLENLPSRWQLIIKLHPHLYQQFDSQILVLKSQIEERPNLLLVEEFPAIYPLLDKVDLYIGDRSSIGYDFLAFDRPMVFFDEPNPNLPLLSCGPLANASDPYSAIAEELSHPKRHALQRRALYERTFGKCKTDLHSLFTEILTRA